MSIRYIPDYPKLVSNATYGRFYEVEKGVFFPSVSTISSFGTPFSYGLLKYIIKQADGDYDKYLKQSSEALDVGTLVHEYVDLLLKDEVVEIQSTFNGRSVPLDPQQRAVLSFLEFWKRYKPEVIAKEHLLYTTEKDKSGEYILPVCGRCDLVARIDGDIWMLDYKTSKSKVNPQYGVQLTLYAWLWNLTHDKDNQIDKLGVVHLKKDWKRLPTKPIQKYEYNQDLARSAYKIFTSFYESYERDGMTPKTREPLPKTFNLKEYLDEA